MRSLKFTSRNKHHYCLT